MNHNFSSTVLGICFLLSACRERPATTTNTDEGPVRQKNAKISKGQAGIYPSSVHFTGEGDRPENTIALSLAVVDRYDLTKPHVDEIATMLIPIFDALKSDDAEKQRAGLALVGTPFGSMGNAGAKYENLSKIIRLWALNASAPPPQNVPIALDRLIRERNKQFTIVIDRIIALYDANNSQSVKLALHSLLDLSVPVFAKDSGNAIMEAWRASNLYQTLTAN